ncbi:MAG: AMP-binding protein [Pseudomonadales bacterium]|nr:AMP-binding protein [Pseudomonadales bacterium]MCP5172243.1 AMP-binding protein [Pseudomonadales bacterium]
MTRYNARNYPDKPALLFENNVISMSCLDKMTNQFANGLIDAGVKPGDRVVFYGSNSDDFLIALLGAAKASAVFVPLNWRLAVEELQGVLEDATPAMGLVNSELSETWAAVNKLLPFKLQTKFVTPGVPESNPFREWIGKFSDEDPMLECGLDDLAWILYTSGTTGKPKGVEFMHSGIILMRMCEHFEPAYTWDDNDTLLFVAPNFHLLGIGLTIQALFNGGTIAVVKAFSPKLVLEEIQSKKPTILAVAPVMIQMLIEDPAAADSDFSSIREVVYAGSSISLGVIKRALEFMPCRFMQFYGSTESGGAITLLRPEEHDLSNEKRLTSCGKPLPLIDIKVMTPDGVELPDGEAGEMWIRVPSISRGYRNKPKAWSEVYDNGWFKSGDVAYRDEEGFLYIVDRAKDMIVTGGENVYCSEVENCLSLHKAVQRVAIIGVPSERWGEEVKACVVLNEGYSECGDELITYAKERLAGYKCPKSVDFFSALPLGGTGKVLKRELRQPYWDGQERNV